MKKPFRERLLDGPIVCDGAIGTLLDMRGFREMPHEAEILCRPEVIEDIHREYREAGAEIIEANTFGANAIRLSEYHLEDRVRVINLAAVAAAQRAAGDDAYVAGAVGPTGRLLEPIGSLKLSEARAAFHEQIEALVEARVDLLMLETFVNLDELDEAITAAKELTDLPIVAQRAFPEDGALLATRFPSEVLERIRDRGVDVVGSNCTVGPQRMFSIMKSMHSSGVILSAQPAAGIPMLVEGRAVYHATPEYLATYARELLKTGVTLIGACCGSTPDHIRAISKVVREFRDGAPSTVERVSVRTAAEPEAEEGKMQSVSRSAFARNIGRKFLTSVELDIPRGFDISWVFEGAAYLKDQGIDAINITDGARARLRMSPVAISHLLQRRVGIEAMTHMTCRDRNLLGLQADLLAAHALGVLNLLAITGDPANIGDYPQATSVFDVDSIGLIRAASAMNRGQDIMGNSLGGRASFLIACAVNPLADDLEREMDRLARKVEAGAEVAYTQPVYEVETLQKLILKAEPLHLPIMVGVLPLRGYRHAEFLHNEVPGLVIPEKIRERLRKGGERTAAVGVEIAGEFLREARTMVQGVYLMPPFRKNQLVIDILGFL